jgi:uncharacterized protein (DUF4415 family)
MGEEGRIVRTTLEEAKARIARGEDRTDWVRVDALTEEELEASIDFEEEGYPIPGTGRMIYDPACKREIMLKLDPDVIEFFQAGGSDFADRMNAVLRRYVVVNAK